MAIYIGLIVDDDDSAAHIAPHDVTLADVRDAVQWPAGAQAAWDTDPEHGPRCVATGFDSRGRLLLVALDPLPRYLGATADTWRVRTAYPLS